MGTVVRMSCLLLHPVHAYLLSLPFLDLLPSDSLPSRDFLKGELVKISAFVAFFSRRLCLAGTVDKVTDPECSCADFLLYERERGGYQCRLLFLSETNLAASAHNKQILFCIFTAFNWRCTIHI